MKTRAKVATVAASAAAIALGLGGTYALWSDTILGNDITASTGHLDVDMTDAEAFDASEYCEPTIDPTGTDYENGSVDWEDCSLDPASHPVGALADFKLVPEDTIRVAAPILVDLAGENIAAELVVDTTDLVTAGWDAITIDPSTVKLVEAADAAEAVSTSATSATGNKYVFTDGADTTVYAVFDIYFDDVDVTGIKYGKAVGDAAADADYMDLTAQQVVEKVSAELRQIRG